MSVVQNMEHFEHWMEEIHDGGFLDVTLGITLQRHILRSGIWQNERLYQWKDHFVFGVF